MKKNYHEEFEPPYTPLLVIKESARCLLCHDAPCSKACPAETDPAKFIRSVRFRNFKGAAEVIRENNALGSICARVCPTEKLCQKGCSRSGIDKPIEIGKIQRFVTDFEYDTNMKILQKGTQKLGKIAIVGSGPAGLQASATLSKLGYQVTVYEKEEQLGGWLRHGIPEYRLPNVIVDREIERIKNLGVTFINKKEIGKDISLEDLKKENAAVLLTIGSSHGRKLEMFNNNLHVETAVEFLARAKANPGKIEVPESVLIVGGGDVAMDAATTLKMLGATSVTCVAREEINELPAGKKEFEDAHTMNVSVIDGFTPIAVNNNEVTFEHVRLNSKLVMSADKIILAVGQVANVDNLKGVTLNRGLIEVKDFATNVAGVFAAGDIIQGEKTVVYAVKLGKEAAYAIHKSLGGKQ